MRRCVTVDAQGTACGLTKTEARDLKKQKKNANEGLSVLNKLQTMSDSEANGHCLYQLIQLIL